MNSKNLTPAEKALIEKEFLNRQEFAERKRRNTTKLFIGGLVAAFIAAATSMVAGLTAISFSARVIWLVGTITFFIYRGGSVPYSHGISRSYVTNPWRDSLGELKEPRNIIQAASLLGAFSIFRLFFAFVYQSIK